MISIESSSSFLAYKEFSGKSINEAANIWATNDGAMNDRAMNDRATKGQRMIGQQMIEQRMMWQRIVEQLVRSENCAARTVLLKIRMRTKLSRNRTLLNDEFK